MASRNPTNSVSKTWCFTPLVDDGSVRMAIGPAADPAATLSTDLTTLLSLGAGTMPFAQAAAANPDALTGDPEAGLRMAVAFGVTGAKTGVVTQL